MPPPLDLTGVLADRYRIERELGRGGMATVWLAADLKHGRRVAIKVLHPAIAAIVGADRFLREIQVMATLQHPHIIPLFDSGEIDGHPYYVMPFIEGETLQTRLTREKRLGLEEATRLTREVASALDFAHRHRIVHRDVKPANILLSDGHALVSDFGIAQAVQGDAETTQRLTATGMSVGTPGYMSPEQAAGGLAVDGRTDVFSLAAVTHEMLAGTPPFHGPSAQAVLARTLTEQPPPLDQLRRGLAPGVSAAVQRALAFEPADRFSTPIAFAEALEASLSTRAATPASLPRRGLIAGIAIVLLALGALWLARRSPTSAPTGTGVRVAVLPFREAGDTAIPGFVLGLTAALRGDLATLPGVDVIAGTSIAALGDSARNPRYLADQLGASHVLSGTVQWSRSADGSVRVLVGPEVVDLRSGQNASVRSQAIEDRIDELFGTQRRLSTQIAQTLGFSLSAEAVTRLAKPPTRNRAAFEALLKAGSDERQAMAYLEQAVALDSTFGMAWAYLSLAASYTYRGTARSADADLARKASARALALDSLAPTTQLAASMYQRIVERNYAAAVRHGEAAIRLAPGDADLLTGVSVVMFHHRQFDDALRLARKAADLDPRNASALARVQNLLQWKRDLDAASVMAGRALSAGGRRVGFILLDSIWLPLMRGNLPAAQTFAQSQNDTARAALAIIADRDWLQGWALDTATVRLGLDRLLQEGDRLYTYVVKSREAWRRGDQIRVAAYADSAAVEGAARLKVPPAEERLRLAVGYTQVLAGRCDKGLAASDTAQRAQSAWHDGFFGAGVSLVRAEMLAMCGRADESIALLDSLSTTPGFVTPDWLRIDPHLVSLQNHPRFRVLLQQGPKPAP